MKNRYSLNSIFSLKVITVYENEKTATLQKYNEKIRTKKGKQKTKKRALLQTTAKLKMINSPTSIFYVAVKVYTCFQHQKLKLRLPHGK